ncbi:MAG: hypothetical protein H3C47_05770 [Candidatus Cloacimonetes bacterium]|nr:hypothetical protein [Candidatus Cloacimonadota bacterium]
MTSLEVILLVFLSLCCLLFSTLYAFIDFHHSSEIRQGILVNFRDYFLGLCACGLVVLIIQSL